ncbi:MAG TPA: FtsH protease activity modulator HflK [Steroidobacteraceae bacterium]|nr:FtsH protease activity modulator HflK [Steroidobacteraceae bacterium]
MQARNTPADPPGATPRGGAPGGTGRGGLQDWRRRWSGGDRQVRGALYAAAAGVALALWLASGFYLLEDGERGVLQRFGAYAGERGSGAGWHLPWPIETLTVVDLGRLNSADFQSRMLTRDGMLLNVTASVTYHYADARAALFAVRHPDALVAELAEAALRESVGQQAIAALMGGATRAPLSEALPGAIQQALDRMHTGMQIVAVNLTDVQVPEAVLAAQRDRVQASADSERAAREAQGYADEQVPAAKGQAEKQRLEAAAYKAQVIGAAEAEAARFAPIAAAYARAPAVTRNQLYIETIESILARSRKIIIDGKGVNTLMLPLDHLAGAGVLKAAGVQGIVSVAAGAEPGAGTGAAPAAASAPAHQEPAAPAPGAGAVDERSRERETRP